MKFLWDISISNGKLPYPSTAWKVSVFGVSLFSLIRTEYAEILRVSLYSVRMLENTNQKNSKYEHFLHSEICYRKRKRSLSFRSSDPPLILDFSQHFLNHVKTQLTETSLPLTRYTKTALFPEIAMGKKFHGWEKTKVLALSHLA